MEICLLCTEEHRKGNSLTKELENGFTVEDAIRQYFVAQKTLLTDPTSTSICMICFKTIKNFYEFTSQIDNRFPQPSLDPPEPPTDIKVNPESPKPITEVIEFDPIEEDFQTAPDYIEEHLEEDFIEPEPIIKKSSRKVGRPRSKNEELTPPYKVRRLHPKSDTESDQKIKNLTEMKCHECNEEFDKFIEVTKHFRECHPGITAYLICCNKKFTKRAVLLDHIEFHDKSALHRCEKCAKEFRSRAILRQHQRKFHFERQEPVMCGVCGKFFSNKYTLKTHSKCHVIDESREFECYICKKMFKNHAKLLDHFKYRHDPVHNRLAVCHICSKAVTRLEIHLEMVHSEEPIERVRCEICGHNLKITSLKGHMRKHQDNEGHTCTICNQFLKNKATLSCHMKRVHGEGKYRCEYCGKKYHQKGHLQDHIACQHTGNYLHKCRVEGCEKQFRNVGRRGLHEKRMHRFEYETRFKPIYLRDNVEIVEYLEDVDEDGNGGENEVVMQFEVVEEK